MSRIDVKSDYFEWMFDLVCKDRYSRSNSYRKLLAYLHDEEFTYTMTADVDRAYDGVGLRRRFALSQEDVYDYEYVIECLRGTCSVLEMMVALAIRCEEQIMDDPTVGNRTGQWFWKMIVNLGLGSMNDSHYDEIHVMWTIDRFLSREYDADGHGGLFIVKDCERNLRRVPIWEQLCYFLDTMI